MNSANSKIQSTNSKLKTVTSKEFETELKKTMDTLVSSTPKSP